MKTFCKLTAQSPAASYVPLPRFSYDEALLDISNDAKVLLRAAAGQSQHFPGRTATPEPDGTIRLYFTLEQAQIKPTAAARAPRGSSENWSTAV